MGDGIYVALSGAIAQSAALEATANNLANASTAGFRAQRPVFHEVLARSLNKGGVLRPAAVTSTAVDTTPGAIRDTGRPLDVALSQDAFLAVSTPRGERFTRAGSIQIGTDGTLRAVSGDPILSESGAPIKVDTTKPTAIREDGSCTSGGDVVARLRVVEFKPTDALTPEGSTLFAAPAGVTGAPSKELVKVGAIEESNASPVRSMTDLMTASRTFEAFSRVLEAFHDADHKAAVSVLGTG